MIRPGSPGVVVLGRSWSALGLVEGVMEVMVSPSSKFLKSSRLSFFF